MKRLVLMIIPALICGVILTNCEKAEQKSDLGFTSDDIISFNVSSGEIVFTKAKENEILSHIDHSSELQLFIGNKPVFAPPIAIMHLQGDGYCCSPCPWASFNDLGLIIFNSGAFVLMEGYLPWFFLSDDEKDREAILKKQEENSKKRKKELEVLINYLSKVGKIVE